MNGLFPEDSAARKEYPVYSGFVQYFPSAIAAIAHHSYIGNQKHNPGQPLHHDRAKSDDEADAQLRHLMETDYVGMGWRAMSLLQKHLESQGAPIAPAARNAKPVAPSATPPDPAATEALRERVEAADAEDLGLKAGEAYADERLSENYGGTDPEDEEPTGIAFCDHAIQYSNATTPAGAQSGTPLNYPSNEDGS